MYHFACRTGNGAFKSFAERCRQSLHEGSGARLEYTVVTGLKLFFICIKTSRYLLEPFYGGSSPRQRNIVNLDSVSEMCFLKPC